MILDYIEQEALIGVKHTYNIWEEVAYSEDAGPGKSHHWADRVGDVQLRCWSVECAAFIWFYIINMYLCKKILYNNIIKHFSFHILMKIIIKLKL